VKIWRLAIPAGSAAGGLQRNENNEKSIKPHGISWRHLGGGIVLEMRREVHEAI